MKSPKIFLSILGASTLVFSASMANKNPEIKFEEPQNPTKVDTIIIKEKSKKKNTVSVYQYLNEDNLAFLLSEKKAAFVHYGFAPYYNDEFEKKYGVKIFNQGCIISSDINGLATKNNQVLANYLTEKFGEKWKKDLGITPFGVK